MFYLKYRPQKFSEIIKNNEAADVLSKQIKNGKTVHAYLFTGPRGTGKTSTARILAKALNCPYVDEKGDPCDECDICKQIKSGSFIDLIEIDAASNRGIDDIRELRERIKLAPVLGKTKVFIIDEVHMLTSEAFNALLKTLEEPPKNTVFVLCTTEIHKVPETIKSRCQVFKFKRASVKQIVEKLQNITKKEKISVKEEDLIKIAQVSLGGFRDAETLIQQVVEGDIDIDALQSLGSKDAYIQFADSLLRKDASEALNLLNNVYEEGIDLYVWLGEFLKYLRDLLFIKSGAENLIEGATSEFIDDMNKQAQKTGPKWIADLTDIMVKAHQEIRSSFIPQLPVELAIIQMCENDENKVTTKRVKAIKVNKTIKIKPNKTVPDELEKIKDKWKDIIEESKGLNRSIFLLLKNGFPTKVEGKFLILQVGFPFHKERIESVKNKRIIEGLVQEICSVDIKIKCEVNEALKPKKKLKKGETGVLTDKNITPIEDNIFDKEAVLSNFDGSLPILS